MQEWQKNQDMPEKFDDTKPVKNIVEFFSDIQPGNALDIGCGTGRNAIWLAENGWEVDAIDSSKERLKVAKERSQHKVLESDTISFIHSDLESYEPKRQYDAVICGMVLHFLSVKEIESAIKKIKSWTKVGGYVYVSVHTDENPAHHRPTLFRKDQLVDYFDDWTIEKRDQKPTDSIIMPGQSGSQIFYCDRIVAKKPSVGYN